MSNPKDGPAVNVEVDDPEAAFHRLEDFTRKILAVPKKEIDSKISQVKTAKRKSGRRRA